MRIAVLVKQVPKFEEMELGSDGRLKRDGIELELNPYCRRAVSQAVALAAARRGSRVTVITLGPPAAEDSLRESIAWGMQHGVDIGGVLVSDPAFAGSDTLATARALAAALEHVAAHDGGAFDLVLTGRNSVDADTGQVGPELAQLCDLPFLSGVRHLSIGGDVVSARCEHDDGWLQAEVHLPAILSCAERLIDPAKVEPPERAAVAADRIRRLSAADLGPGPWGQSASPTSVGDVKVMAVSRTRQTRPDAPIADQTRDAVRRLHERGAFWHAPTGIPTSNTDVVAPSRPDQPLTIVVAEPDRAHDTRELLGAAAALTANVLVVTVDAPAIDDLGAWGADAVVHFDGDNVEEEVATEVVRLAREATPWAILTGSTAWGREVASRVAAQLGAGLTGDAVELERVDDRLVAWKPAFGGQLVAAIHCASDVQMATVRAGVLPTLKPRPVQPTMTVDTTSQPTRNRVRVLAPHARRQPRRSLGGTHRHRPRPGRTAGGVRRPRTVARAPRSRAGSHAQGHRQRVAAACTSDRDHRQVDRAPPVREHRRERKVQPHDRPARGGDRARDQHRSARTDLRGGRRRYRRRLARGGAAARRAASRVLGLALRGLRCGWPPEGHQRRGGASDADHDTRSRPHQP